MDKFEGQQQQGRWGAAGGACAGESWCAAPTLLQGRWTLNFAVRVKNALLAVSHSGDTSHDMLTMHGQPKGSFSCNRTSAEQSTWWHGVSSWKEKSKRQKHGKQREKYKYYHSVQRLMAKSWNARLFIQKWNEENLELKQRFPRSGSCGKYLIYCSCSLGMEAGGAPCSLEVVIHIC